MISFSRILSSFLGIILRGIILPKYTDYNMYKQVFLNFSFIITQESSSNILEDLFCLQFSIAFEKFQACGQKFLALEQKSAALGKKVPSLGSKLGQVWMKKRKHLLPALFTAHADLDAFSFISAFIKDEDISSWE